MLTPKDIENPARKSGYNYVGVGSSARYPSKKPYQAMKRPSKEATGNRAVGPRRATALEAAQDYCDYMNGLSTPLTPKDLENPARKSGYDHVLVDDGARRSGHGGTTKAYQANGGRPDGPVSWGPRRRTAIEAAQDYCDYVNNKPTTSLPSYPSVVIDMGNVTVHQAKAEPVKVIRPKYEGPHDVYDVLIVTSNDDIVCRKVGITARGHARYADVCKTLGLSIKPYAPAVTYPSSEAALEAERAKVAEVCGDKKWRRVAKEAFVPVGDSK